MKRTAMIGIVLATIAVLGVSAWGPGTGQGMFWNNQDLEETELAGRLQLAKDEVPVLVVGTEQYQLMIPPALAAEIDVENNERISVTGYETEFANPDLLGSTKVIRVRAIEADGKTVVLPEGAAGGRGHSPGMVRGGAAGRGDDNTGRWGSLGQSAPGQAAPNQGPGTFGGRRR